MRKVHLYLLASMLLTPNALVSGGCFDDLPSGEVDVINRMMEREKLLYCSYGKEQGRDAY